MPLSKEAIRRLSMEELSTLFGEQAFQSQQENIARELLTRNGVVANLFVQIHNSAGCHLDYMVDPKPYRDSSMTVDGLLSIEQIGYKLVCKDHQSESSKFFLLSSKVDDLKDLLSQAMRLGSL